VEYRATLYTPPVDPADLSPIPESARTQSAFDLFLIFAAANVVATTLQTGAVLGKRYGNQDALVLVVSGAVFGAILVALLAPVGSRFGVPSMIAARAALGRHGAALVAALLYLTNFAWIAVNNTIAASVCAEVFGGSTSARLWSAGLGVLATLVVARGPRAVGQADRVAVPLMAIAGTVFTWAAITGPPTSALEAPPTEQPPLLWGLDVVIGYQVSWLLMFADYSRYTRSGRASATAVFAGLALPALWLMPVGWILARVASSDDPGTMLSAAGVGGWAALLVALATVTTNFVNIYLSSLAWRTLVPNSSSTRSVWTIGLIGTALGLISSVWLTRFADLMLILGSVLVPVGGVFLAHFVVLRRPVDVSLVYQKDRLPAFTLAGMLAWALGFIVYRLAASIGATLPALAASVVAYVVLDRRRRL
ncbi:MAG: cytosine permease, partial [Vicinamibacterales bacterium]